MLGLPCRFCAWDAHIEPSYRDLYKTGFYAGVPLVGSDGYNYGTLCVFDRQPRSFTLDMYCLLISFSELVSREIERGCHTALPQCKVRVCRLAHVLKLTDIDLLGSSARDNSYKHTLTLSMTCQIP